MTEIKHALAFIFGVLYASCWWIDANDSAWMYPKLLGIIFGSIFLVIPLIYFMTYHWDEK